MNLSLMGAPAGAFCGGGAVGAAGAWWAHRRTRLSAWNLYALAPLGVAVWLLALGTQRLALLPAAGAAGSAGMVAASRARRYRLAALGATGELRDFETSRVMAWTALHDRARRRSGERTRIANQGELVRERSWPDDEPFVPMSDGELGRVPSRQGQHLLIVGATGSGKTVSARRWLLARIIGDGVGVLVTDPKGDRALARDLQDAARLVERPFVLFDPRSPDSSRWNPLWSEDTGAVVSRLVAPIGAGEGNARYYADLLQIHLGTVAAGLRAAGLWPANIPLLLDAAQLSKFDDLLQLVRRRAEEDSEIVRRLREHRAVLASPEARRDLTGGILRLRVAAGETWRDVLTPPALRAMFSDVVGDRLADENPFARLGMATGRGREDIIVLTLAELQKLTRLARAHHGGAFGEEIAALIVWAAYTCMRPGEIFAARYSELHGDTFDLRRQFNSMVGRETAPKHNSRGLIYVPEPAQRAVLDKPRRLGDDLIFRSKRGAQFRQESQWRFWDPIRRAFTASLPETHHLRERVAADEEDQLDLYELRHFGASYMLNELELEPWVIAEQLRHTDGGRLVLELYGHPDRNKAIERMRRAFTGASISSINGTDSTSSTAVSATTQTHT